ncbi:OmpA family protein [Haemophilus haemoglobinophilus]|nr:OmpA family protein [Canicola haemoglobinophilus]
MKKLIIVTAVTLALSACSMRSANQPLEVWQNYENAQVNASSLKDEQAMAVFYRQDNVNGNAVNIYINGDYQASLLANSFTNIPVCASSQIFGASFVTNQKFNNNTNSLTLQVPAKKTIYIKVINGKNGQPQFEQVSELVATKEVVGLRKANQTLSRTQLRCDNSVLSRTSFSAGALFGLNKSSYQDISVAGRKEIAEFAEQVKAFDARKISKIEVSGYTDPEGSDNYNLKLSQKRAQAVALALKNAKVTSKIEAKGYGESNLIKNDCHTLKNKAELAACNQVNRRVEVTVYGNK